MTRIGGQSAASMQNIASSGSMLDRLRAFGDDSAAVLDVDVPCCGCGYNVRGASPGGACPECGVDVGQSVALVVERPSVTWLGAARRSVSRAAVIAAVGWVLFVTGVVAIVASSEVVIGCSMLMSGLMLPMAAVAAIDRPLRLTKDPVLRWSGWVVRLVSVVLGVGFFVLVLGGPHSEDVGGIAGMVCLIGLAALIFAVTAWARRVSLRIDRRGLARSVTLIGVAGGCVALVTVGLTGWVLWGATIPIHVALGVMFVGCMLGLIGWAAAMTVMLVIYRSVLGTALGERELLELPFALISHRLTPPPSDMGRREDFS